MLIAISNLTCSNLNCSCHSLQQLGKWLLHPSSFLAKNNGPIFDSSVSLCPISYPSSNCLSCTFKIMQKLTFVFLTRSKLSSIISPLCYCNCLLTGLLLLSLSTNIPLQPVWAFYNLIWITYFFSTEKTQNFPILLKVKARVFKLLFLVLSNWMFSPDTPTALHSIS